MGYLGTFLGTDLTVGMGTNLAPRSLPFSKASYTNASSRHILADGSMTGPFAGGTLATRVVGGKRFAQLEASRSTLTEYSEQINTLFSGLQRLTMTADQTTSPIGTITADRISETADTGNHQAWAGAYSVANTVEYTCSCFFYPDERTQAALVVTGVPVTVEVWYDLSTATPTTSLGSPTFTHCEILDNGWVLCAFGFTAGSTGNITPYLNLRLAGVKSYAGVLGYGLYAWGYQIIDSTEYLTSFIPSIGVPTTREKDQFYWPEAVVPSWMRTGFKARLVMHQGSSAMLTADGGTKYIAHFDATAETIYIYFDGADNKIKWAGSSTGALGESAALTWSLGDVIDIEFTFDNGSNSTLKVDGGGVDTTYTGISTAASNGSVYYGMDTSEANQLDIALLSEPEPL